MCTSRLLTYVYECIALRRKKEKIKCFVNVLLLYLQFHSALSTPIPRSNNDVIVIMMLLTDNVIPSIYLAFTLCLGVRVYM